MVGDVPDDVKVVGHEQHAQAALVPELLQQVQDVPLHRDVQRRGGFVGQQHPRIAGQGQGDHDPLLLAATQFVGVFVLGAFGQAHFVEQARHFSPGRLAHRVPMKFERLGDLRPHPHRRVERGHRVLKHHRHVSADRRTMPSGLGPHGTFGAAHFTVGEGARARQEAHHGQGSQGFARPGLAHDARGLA